MATAAAGVLAGWITASTGPASVSTAVPAAPVVQRFIVGGVWFTEAFPGTVNVRRVPAPWLGGSYGVEYVWSDNGPDGRSEVAVDVFPSAAPVSAAEARSILATSWGTSANGTSEDGLPALVSQSCTPWSPASAFSCVSSASAVRFERHAMFELQAWGPDFGGYGDPAQIPLPGVEDISLVLSSFRTGP